MTFEEKFPELKDKLYYLSPNGDKFYIQRLIEECCLDKSFVIQQIKETFELLFDLEQEQYTINVSSHRINALKDYRKKLIKRLGE